MRLGLSVLLVVLAAAGCGSEPKVSEELLMSIPVTGGELNAVRGGDLCDRPATAGPLVLFLHGASFNANTWVETGTHQILCETGIPSVSLDLPGFGNTPRFDHQPAQLLDEVVAYLESDVIVVSPSMSGGYSLPWLATNPTTAAGFIPVAPVGIGAWTPPAGFAVPTLGIWGSTDSIVPVATGRRFVESVAGELVIIEGGGHAVYKTNSDEFHDALVGFVRSLRP
jgi:pimeloyl-ACP methyl ester carboxylesterase